MAPQDLASSALGQLSFLAVLNRDSFGKVVLAKAAKTQKLYAVKVQEKSLVIDNDETSNVRSEKEVFLTINNDPHPFLMRLYACFQTEACLCFVGEFVSGGSLIMHLQDGEFGTERARFYAAEICLALKYLHEKGIIHRDVQPSAVVLTQDGHAKLMNYGLCKQNIFHESTTRTFCGTAEFAAPEMLLGGEYGQPIDWWGFGVLLYQMLVRQSPFGPFLGEDADDVYDAILEAEPNYPADMSDDAVSIIDKLLAKEPGERLGSGERDAYEVMSEPFFSSIHWDDLYHQRVQPPFVPPRRYRAQEGGTPAVEATNVESLMGQLKPTLSQQDQEAFKDFDYVADFT